MADYTLSAKITGDASGFSKAFDTANKKLNELSKQVQEIGKSISNTGQQMTNVGKGISASFTAPIVGAVGFAVKSFADLEQAVGGVETLFKDSANTVIANSETAFRRAGVSGVSYMEQVTSFSASLLQGLAGDTVAAAKYADMAIVDMSDNANKMGTDIAMLQNAYQGFAKDNFTMLDNLKLGYGGTAGEMARLVNDSGVMGKSFKATAENVKDIPFDQLIQAIHITQKEMDITGTTALEAEKTVSGSFQSMVSAGENLAAGLGNPAANVQGLMSNLQETVMTFAGNIQRVLGTIWNNLPLDEWQKWAAVIAISIGPVLLVLGTLTSVLGGLISTVGFLISPIGLIIGGIAALGVAFGIAMAKSESFRNLVMGVFTNLKDIVSEVISTVLPIMQRLFQSGLEGAQSFADGLGGKLLGAFETVKSVVLTVVDVIGQFVSSVVGGFKGAGGEVNSLSALFLGLNPVLKIAMMIFTQFGPQIAQSFSKIASMAVPLLNLLGETIGQLAATIIPAIMNVISTLIPVILNLGMSLMEIISAVLPVLISLFVQLVPVVMSLVNTVIGLVAQLLPLVATLIDALVPILMMLIDVILNIVQAVAPALIAIIGAVIAIFQAIMPVVMAILSTVINVMANIIAAIMPIIAFVAMIITTIVAIIAPIITFIANVIAAIFKVITPIIVFVTGVFNSVFSVVSGVFQSIMQFISGAIQTISGVISKLSGTVSQVFNTIWNKVSSIMEKVSSKIQGVFTAITTSWTGLKTFVSGVFTGIGDSMQSLVGRVKGFINNVIGGINGAIGIINKIPGVEIKKIPQLQRGTDDWVGGFARMNEGGRGEMVMLPSGSQVIPHDVSMKYAREAGQASAKVSQGGYQENRETNVSRRPLNITMVMDSEVIGRATKGTIDLSMAEDVLIKGLMEG